MCFWSGDKIVDEVRRIMGPRQSVSYNSAVCGMSANGIPRRLKRKGKYQLAVEKYATSKRKPRPNTYTFQKKLLYVYSNIWVPMHPTISHGWTRIL